MFNTPLSVLNKLVIISREWLLNIFIISALYVLDDALIAS